MSHYLGDFEAGDTVFGKFTTRQTSGAPIVLAGAAALVVYQDGSTTESSTGVTLTTNFDSIVGLNHYAIATASSTSFFVTGSQYSIMISAGTVNGVTVAGETVGRFSLGWLLKPETQGRKLRVGTNSQADANVTQWRGTANTTSDIAIKTTLAKTTDITGFNDPSAAANATATWDALASAHTVAGSYGLFLDTTVSSRLASASYTAPATTTQIADGVLDRDMSSGADSGSASVRTARQALRFLRNKWVANGTSLTVFKEDDSTTSWTSVLTATASATPITGSDPA